MEKLREDVDVLIVGAGPAGLSAALHLVAENPSWAGRIQVIDKAHFPRAKLCGGGLSPTATCVLAKLGVALKSPVVLTQSVRLNGARSSYTISLPLCIVNREEFDAELLSIARERGVRVSEGEALQGMRWHKSDWEVETSRRVLRVKVVVGADGVQSAVRKFAGFSTKSDGRAASLLEVEFPAAKKDQSDQNDKTIIVDFSEMGRGLFGYSWIFPFVKNGQPHLRCGVFDNFLFLSQSKWKREKSLNQILHQTMERNGIEPSQNELGGWSLRCFRLKSPIATERLLLVGDAAGVDPLFGEGLSYSLQYGATAAQSIVRAFASENFAFSNYKRNFIKSSIGWNLVLRSLIANALARVPWLARSGVLDFFWRFCVLLFPREV